MSKFTERMIWRENEQDEDSPGISITADNEVAITVGNTVIVRDIRTWHQLAKDEIYQNAKQTMGSYEPSKLDKVERYLHVLYEAHKVDHRVDKEIGEALEQFKKEAGI